jgi:K+-transporting ATPase ATPase C chain
VASQIRCAVVLFFLLTALAGGLYPLLVTAIAQAVFPRQAAGSLVERNGAIVGSALIGQSFTQPQYFWGRPSATAPMPYNAANSGGSNQAPTNPALIDAVKGRIAALREADPRNPLPVPVELVTASGSGLDPHVSLAAARYQAARVAGARNLPMDAVEAAIARHTEGPLFGLIGEPRVNVLELNLDLDRRAGR